MTNSVSTGGKDPWDKILPVSVILAEADIAIHYSRSYWISDFHTNFDKNIQYKKVEKNVKFQDRAKKEMTFYLSETRPYC